MRYLIRVDASREIGSGHVMRCLCLAEALRVAGHETKFLCRRRNGDLIELIEARGFDCTTLPAAEHSQMAAEWLGASMMEEIEQSRPLVAAEAPDWLVVDHYALDAEWEREVTPWDTRVMVIDDLANRPHACDLLLDQQLTNRPADHAKLIPHWARIMLGPAYALLRPEFSELRPAAEARVRAWPPGRILVNLGGIDQDNATLAVLETLARSDLPVACEIDVVMGRNAPHIENVRAYAETSYLAVHVHVDVVNIGKWMLAADLGIGAAGTACWERACLGLPSLMLSIAENQIGVAEALDRAGAAINLGPLWEPGWSDRMLSELPALSAPERLRAMSDTCLALVDGSGTSRVVQVLTAPPLDLRPCTLDDAERVWTWREADDGPQFYRSGLATPWETHRSWFVASLNDARRVLLIAEDDGGPIAHLRFDLPETGLPEVSLVVDPRRKGSGLGLGTVALAVRYARQMAWPGLVAEVHEDNTASARVFERNGFHRVGQSGKFFQYKIDLIEGVPA